jgi:transcriptional regulator of acetoin/glycerol metabolism
MPDDLPDAVRRAEAAPAGGDEALLTLDEVEKRHLSRVLRETGGNKVRAARILGIDRRTLYRMAERFGIDLGEEGAE